MDDDKDFILARLWWRHPGTVELEEHPELRTTTTPQKLAEIFDGAAELIRRQAAELRKPGSGGAH